MLEKISGLSSSNIDEIVIKCAYKRKDNYGNAYRDFKKFNAALSIANEKRYKYEEESEKTFEVKSKKLPKKVDDFKNYIKKKQIKENVKKRKSSHFQARL